ncbi:cleavage and polyadenylation specificity factor subunit 4-like isoform X2 [Gordionus sp. m RMFG-2023]|uniref:cleavage and polyadenylation specificity factor subunit 4-like isoform X2 n=1 Tax=Gordionus sp. m RMFG-2023 TaxID=3053472 RepID=UPI0031FC9DCD
MLKKLLTPKCGAYLYPLLEWTGDKNVVCKHWLRGLCKKGDDCEFLHEYDMTKMPECYFFSKYNACNNKECPFLHIDPESKIKDCQWYDRGFCRHGPNCKNRHIRKVMCQSYLNGFCPEGRECKFMHASFDAPHPSTEGPCAPHFHHHLNFPYPSAMSAATLPGYSFPSAPPPIFHHGYGDRVHTISGTTFQPIRGRGMITCHYCGELGHKLSHCPKLKGEAKITSYMPSLKGDDIRHFIPRGTHHFHAERRNLEDVVCYRCGEKGHFANRCPKTNVSYLQNSQDSSYVTNTNLINTSLLNIS